MEDSKTGGSDQRKEGSPIFHVHTGVVRDGSVDETQILDVTPAVAAPGMIHETSGVHSWILC